MTDRTHAPASSSSSLHCLALHYHDHVLEITLNRPDALNTLHPQFWRELDQVLQDVQREGHVRAVVITSTGRHFSAGMALEVFAGNGLINERTAEGRAALPALLESMQATFNRLEDLRMPVIAAIQGGCIGGALDMVSATCLRYATEDAFFCIQEINIGMVADMGTLQRLPKLMPMGIVKEMAYTGRRLSAQRALACGLVNEVFADATQMRDAALACAQEMASKPPIAQWGTKQALHYARDHSVADSLAQMGLLQAAIWSSAQVQEAVVAMREKRAGDFQPLAPLRSFLEH